MLHSALSIPLDNGYLCSLARGGESLVKVMDALGLA